MPSKTINVALAGNPNSGKTTIFNKLTGSNQHVGNWPGVTVEKKEGHFIYDEKTIKLVDLPGTYSLTPYSPDERIARNYIIHENPDIVTVIIDASNLERNLYLVTELLEIESNVLIDLNMWDLVEKNGLEIDMTKLSAVLNCPVVNTVANKGKGINKLKFSIYKNEKLNDNKFKIDYQHDIENAIELLSREFKNIPRSYSTRYFCIKALEGDDEILESIKNPNEREILENEIRRLEKHLGYDIEQAIVEKRYGFIEGLIKECTRSKINLDERHSISDKIDFVLTNRYLGLPIFFLVMWLSFHLIFSIGNPLAGYVGTFFDWLNKNFGTFLTEIGASSWLVSLLSDGVINGVGSVLVFLPNILLLFLIISFLEDSGYMARAAFIVDRIMHLFGLHGKSFIPMMLGFGCNIPGILASRTLENEKDRILTILILPLMSCSARLPIYTLFAGIFFTKNQGLIVFSLYMLGIIISIFIARFFKKLFFNYDTSPLIMELPPYRLPQIQRILVHMWMRARIFVIKAGTIIVAGVTVIWLLANLPPGVEYASKESLIGQLGSFFSTALEPAGFGYWQTTVALMMGIVAKEIVVGTLGTLYGASGAGLQEILINHFTPLSAYAFMVMSLFYIPCLGAIATIKKETNWKWTGITIIYTILLGWILAVLVYQTGSLFIK